MGDSREMVIIIRPSFKKFCGQDACRAALFNHLLYWIAQKTKGQSAEAAKSGEVSWYGTAALICEGLDRSWSVNKVRQEIKALVEAKLIGQRHNPSKGWDQTRHYFFGEEQGKILKKTCEKYDICLLHLGLSADVLHLLNLVNAINKSGKCNCQISEMDLPNMGDATTKSGNAIPKDYTKGFSKDINEGSTDPDGDSSISQSSLEEERLVWSSICQARNVKGAKPNKNERGQITELTELIHTQGMTVEQFTAQFIKDMWAHTLAIKHYSNEVWSVKNLINELPEYVASLPSNQPVEEQQEAWGCQDLAEWVWWTENVTDAFGGGLHLEHFRFMQVAEAKEYGYGKPAFKSFELTPDEIERIEQAQSELVAMEG